jgi:shikimate kinase
MAPERIFLIGYRGTGLLADLLGWSWHDADDVLEKRFGKSIRQMFADEGEPVFRERETAILRELADLKNAVVATGGGVVLKEENRELLRRGIVVWLTAPAEMLWQRLRNDATTAERRPNLGKGGKEEIEELLAARVPLYQECANWQIDTASDSPETVARAILQQLQGEPPA